MNNNGARWHKLLAVFLFFFPFPLLAEQITVFAAASLKNALDEVSAEFESQTGHRVILSYAGSSALARQVQMGAPADIVITANTDWMDYLVQAGAVEPDSRRDILGNELVLVSSRAGSAIDLSAGGEFHRELGDGFLAMALVTAVPAGLYGREALQSLGLWDHISDRIAQVDNVRAALALVALGETPLGIVYATDARADPRVHVRATFPGGSHRDIRYPAAAITDRDQVSAYLDFLSGADAATKFKAHGFSVPDE